MLTTDDPGYGRHIEQRCEQIDDLMSRLGYDALLIHSGRPDHRLFDDQHPPFRAHAPFAALVPLAFAADCLLELRVGRRPRLWYCQPEDFWHAPPAEPESWWADHLDIERVESSTAWRDRFGSERALAAIGQPDHLADLGENVALNPSALLHGLGEMRTRKTGWERECMNRANQRAAAAHLAAAEAFRNGACELDIQLAYLRAAAQDQDQQPYRGIVALNEHAAVLHYQHRDSEPPPQAQSFLLDAGVDEFGYASDITRTWTRPEHAQFAALINEVDALQQRLCEAMKPGVSFVDLHQQAHLGIAQILSQAGLVSMAPADMVESGVSAYFFPHGLGHFIGAQVHDVNGLVDAEGQDLPPPQRYPFLRLTRRLEPDHVVTVEPGLYFIPMLLERLRQSEFGRQIDWAQVEALKPFGGIRIEDNVLVGERAPTNLTRLAFAGLD